MTTPGSLEGLDKIPYDEHSGEKKPSKHKNKGKEAYLMQNLTLQITVIRKLGKLKMQMALEKVMTLM